MGKRFATLVVTAWLVGGSLLGGVLLIKHLVALPVPPADDTALRDAVRSDLPEHVWRAVHVMYRTCGCSQRTIAHLLAGNRPTGLVEEVVIVDDHGAPGPEDMRLRDAGFRVRVIAPQQLHDRYHLDAAPVLVIAAPDGKLGYVGGYNRHKQSAAYEDITLVAELRANESTHPLPVFGCATSARLANALDPLALTKR